MKDLWYNIDATCTSSTATGAGIAEQPIPESLIGWYEECHIANYTRGSLFLLKAGDETKPVEIKRTPLPATAREYYVEVIYRSCNGTRDRLKNGRTDGAVERQCWKIPAEAFQNGPVYLPDLAIILGAEPYKGTMLNPASKTYRETLTKNLSEALGKTMYRQPVSVAANDPTGYCKQLYMIMHGEIVSVGVSHYADTDASDTISLIRRIGPHDLTGVEVDIKTTSFAHLRRMETPVWSIGPYSISPDRQLLEDLLEQEKTSLVPDYILRSEHTRVIARTDTLWEQKVSALEETLNTTTDKLSAHKDSETVYKRKIKTLEERVAELESPEYSERARELWVLERQTAHQKVHNEAEEIRNRPLEEELKRERDKLKWEHEARIHAAETEAAKYKRRSEWQKWIIGLGVAIVGSVKYWGPMIKFLKTVFHIAPTVIAVAA